MEPRDVAPGSGVEERWFDVKTAAKYLCMTRHAIYTESTAASCPSSGMAGGFGSTARRSIAG
jgi:hypothetical protein